MMLFTSITFLQKKKKKWLTIIPLPVFYGVGIEVLFVNFAALRETPCEQAKVLSDAAIFLGINGAELTNLIWLPPGAAVVEVI